MTEVSYAHQDCMYWIKDTVKTMDVCFGHKRKEKNVTNFLSHNFGLYNFLYSVLITFKK